MKSIMLFFVFLCGTTVVANVPTETPMQSTSTHPVVESDLEPVTLAVQEVYHVTMNHVDISRLLGGWSGDRLYKITHGENASCVHIFKRDKSFKTKMNECLCTQNAYDLDLGPKVLYLSPFFDVIVSDFIQGSR